MDLDGQFINSHVLSLETGLPFAHLLVLVGRDAALSVEVHWKRLYSSEDTIQPLSSVYKDVPARYVAVEQLLYEFSKLVQKLLDCNITEAALNTKKHDAFGLRRMEISDLVKNFFECSVHQFVEYWICL